MAEWLRRGLQILARRFDSGSGLHEFSRPTPGRNAALAQLVEHIIRNDGVTCSSHVSGTTTLSLSARRCKAKGRSAVCASGKRVGGLWEGIFPSIDTKVQGSEFLSEYGPSSANLLLVREGHRSAFLIKTSVMRSIFSIHRIGGMTPSESLFNQSRNPRRTVSCTLSLTQPRGARSSPLALLRFALL